MPTPEKALLIQDTQKIFTEATAVYFTDFQGMSAAQATDLRAQFTSANVEYRVLKKSFTRIAAEQAGLRLKLNMVVMRGINDHEVEAFAALSQKHPWSVRFIEYMPTIREAAWKNRVISGGEILERLQQTFALSSISTSRLCGPAKPYRIDGAIGTVGIITPMSEHFCGSCNRIRVTAQGLAKSCLLSDQALDLRPALAQGPQSVREALVEVIRGKNQQHHFEDEERSFQMSGIGG